MALQLMIDIYNFSCKISIQVRAYAVSVLERADDEELKCYLLQLVQALRFERTDKSRLAQFLVQRCMYFLHYNFDFKLQLLDQQFCFAFIFC